MARNRRRDEYDDRRAPRPKKGMFGLTGGCLVGALAGGAGLCVLVCGGCLALVGSRANADARKELAEANRLWDAGHKAEAAAKYEAVLDMNRAGVPAESERPTVYQRIIDAKAERGDTAGARAAIERALDKNINVTPTHPAGVQLLAQMRAERQQQAADEQARKEAERQEQARRREAEEKLRQEERAAKKPGRLAVEIVKVRTEPFHSATGLDTHKVYVDWKNTGDRPVRAIAAKLTVLDAQGAVIHTAREVYIYAVVGNDRPGVAAGETHVTPPDGGTVLPKVPGKSPARAEVEILRVEEFVAE